MDEQWQCEEFCVHDQVLEKLQARKILLEHAPQIHSVKRADTMSYIASALRFQAQISPGTATVKGCPVVEQPIVGISHISCQ